jgi:hypothetical protein
MSLEDTNDGDLIFGSDAARHGWNPSYWMRPAGFFLRARRHGLAMPKLACAFFVADEHATSWPPPMPTRPPTGHPVAAVRRPLPPALCAAANSSVTGRDHPPERSSPVADPLTQARTHLAPLVADHQRRSTPAALAHLEAAAALLANLWAAAAARHSITPDHRAWSFHLPCAALDTIAAARQRHHADRARAGR